MNDKDCTPIATVVIADDYRDAADSNAMLLQLNGHRVQVAYEGAQALDLIRTLRPQAAILDLHMPHLDGYQVARCIRQAGISVKLIALMGLFRPVGKERPVVPR